ncbi:MAG: arsenate reductase ArsC [Bdellovibrionales bacterium]|nr:arsenate reductase ArsC [Bdellovibrionales bacterium]
MRITRRKLLQTVIATPILPLVAAVGGKTTILVLCTGNSARSQMTEGFLKSLDPNLEVFSAGTNPSPRVNPFAIKAMKEIGIDISGGKPKNVRQFLGQPFDYVVTVCDDADKNCPNFTGKVGKRRHIGFPDPAKATGTDDEKMAIFRKVRDDIRSKFKEFYATEIKRA